mmetsp:Transcript_42255/g.133270  ORF Transcript_42255/g.133270 Transcript_42255/m.133270 type:complete len:125 (-) Transcript_42255:1372-1746(-)
MLQNITSRASALDPTQQRQLPSYDSCVRRPCLACGTSILSAKDVQQDYTITSQVRCCRLSPRDGYPSWWLLGWILPVDSRVWNISSCCPMSFSLLSLCIADGNIARPGDSSQTVRGSFKTCHRG